MVHNQNETFKGRVISYSLNYIAVWKIVETSLLHRVCKALYESGLAYKAPCFWWFFPEQYTEIQKLIVRVPECVFHSYTLSNGMSNPSNSNKIASVSQIFQLGTRKSIAYSSITVWLIDIQENSIISTIVLAIILSCQEHFS